MEREAKAVLPSKFPIKIRSTILYIAVINKDKAAGMEKRKIIGNMGLLEKYSS